jgi:hypothetical protein
MTKFERSSDSSRSNGTRRSRHDELAVQIVLLNFPSPVVAHTQWDARIYAIYLLGHFGDRELFSPDGNLSIELLDMSDEDMGIQLSIDWIGKPKRKNLYSLHWHDEQADVVNFDGNKVWFGILEAWYDDVRRVAMAQLPAACPGDLAASPA